MKDDRDDLTEITVGYAFAVVIVVGVVFCAFMLGIVELSKWVSSLL